MIYLVTQTITLALALLTSLSRAYRKTASDPPLSIISFRPDLNRCVVEQTEWLNLIFVSLSGSGIIFFLTKQIAVPILPPYPSSHHPSAITALQGPTSLTISVTPFVNLVLAGLIVGRLWYHQRHIRKILGAHYASPYNKIIAMCIESCSMIIINSVIYIGLYYGADKDGQNFEILTILLIFPHICVSYFTWL